MNGNAVATGDPRPASAVSTAVGLIGLAGLVVWIAIARNFGALAAMIGIADMPERADGPYAALIGVMACGLPMVAWSLLVDKVHRRASTGLDWSLKRPWSETLDFGLTKLAGLWATWGGIALLYSLARWYWSGQYLFSMEVFTAIAPWLFLASVPYVLWQERFLVERRDGCWHFGLLVSGQGGWDRQQVAHHLRAWAVKGFFLAFMVSIVPGGFGQLVRVDFAEVATNPVWIVEWLIIAMFVVDVQIATVGYAMTLKPLDAHIRTANPYMAAWVAALICYPPFILMGEGGPLFYQAGTATWSQWLASHDLVLILWGGWLVVLTAIYAWATVAFGLRFSNLTHRGILTHGPYRFTKHPAYLSKNLYWWFATLPFFVTNGSLSDAARNTALLGVVSLVYYWRARTEEKHLMADPAYAEYAAWMRRNAPIPRFFNWAANLRPHRHPPAEPAE